MKVIVVDHRDRLARFGVEHLQASPRRRAGGSWSWIRVVNDGPNLGQGQRSKSRPRGRGYCAVLSALAEGKVSIPVSLSR